MDNGLPRVKVSAAAGVSRAAANGSPQAETQAEGSEQSGILVWLTESRSRERSRGAGRAARSHRGGGPCLGRRLLGTHRRLAEPVVGPIQEAPGETWLLVAAALALGLRGFPPGGSIPRFLDEHRGRYNPQDPKFTSSRSWPGPTTGTHARATGRMQLRRNSGFRRRQLAHGRRGDPVRPGHAPGRFFPLPFPGQQARSGSCGASVHRGTDPRLGRCSSSADRKMAHHVVGSDHRAPEETWTRSDRALQGIAWSPRRFVACRTARRAAAGEKYALRSAAHDSASPRLGRCIPRTNRAMAYLHFRAVSWRRPASLGFSDLGGHGGTPRLPGRYHVRPATDQTPRVTEAKATLHRSGSPQILAWADAFHIRNGKWPTHRPGPVAEASGETWSGDPSALFRGLRGLPAGTTFAQLLIKHRGYRSKGYARPTRFRRSSPGLMRSTPATGNGRQGIRDLSSRHPARPGMASRSPSGVASEACPAVHRWLICSTRNATARRRCSCRLSVEGGVRLCPAPPPSSPDRRAR